MASGYAAHLGKSSAVAGRSRTNTVMVTTSRICSLFLVASFIFSMNSRWVYGQTPLDGEISSFYAEDARLEKYVQRSLQHNPQLQEALAHYRAALQRVPQVTALPDPMLTFSKYIRAVETRVGPQSSVVNVNQTLPWFGKRDLKGKIAFKEASSQHQIYRTLERAVIADVKRTFYELGYLDRALEITQSEQSLLTHYERLAESRYSIGQGLQTAVIKIQAEITRTINRLELLQQQRRTLAARLNTLMDQTPELPLPATQKAALPRPDLNPVELYALGERHRQELKGAMAHIEGSEQAVELAKKDYWPDVTLGAGMISVGGREDPMGALLPPPDNGKNAYSFTVGINIPLRRDKYRAGVLEATETLIARRHRYAAVRNEMQFSIREQVLRLETLREQLDLFEQALIPQAEEALRSTESAYQTGQLGALELLDSERVLLDVRLIDARQRADYLLALTNLERALGTKFPR